MQAGKLFFQKEQENSKRQIGIKQVLQALQKAHNAQGNKIKNNKTKNSEKRCFFVNKKRAE